MSTIKINDNYIYVADRQYEPQYERANSKSEPKVCYFGKIFTHNLGDTQNVDFPQDVNVCKVTISEK